MITAEEFKKKYPSLVGKGLPDCPDIDASLSDDWWKGATEDNVSVFTKQDVLECTVDKALVEKVLSGHLNPYCGDKTTRGTTILCTNCEAKRELNL